MSRPLSGWRLPAILLLIGLLMNVLGCAGIGIRTGDAVVTAAKDPWTWAPLAGAAAIAATDSDERISHWATSHTPVFGSTESALDASDTFRAASRFTSLGTTLAASARYEGEEWLKETAIDFGSAHVGIMVARNIAGVLKRETDRERPSGGTVHDSFPSAHATDAFANATVARHFADQLPASESVRNGLKLSGTAFAAATAWGRVEGGVHYPTDVLVGAAIANFSSRFFLELTGRKEKQRWWVKPLPADRGVAIEYELPL